MSMILYVTLGISDFDRAARFYDAALAPLGYHRSTEADDGWAGWGPSYDDGVSLWICAPFDGNAPKPGNGAMVAFRANSAAEVRAFYAGAMASGGTDEGPPGVRPQYDPSFYAAYVRDPDGNKLACVYHRYDPAKDHLAP